MAGHVMERKEFMKKLDLVELMYDMLGYDVFSSNDGTFWQNSKFTYGWELP